MESREHFYIDGRWVQPEAGQSHQVINPATEEPVATIRLGDAADVDRAVAAARRAFAGFSETSREERLAWLDRIAEIYEARLEDMAQAITLEMGAPITLSRKAQASAGLGHFRRMRDVLAGFPLETTLSGNLIRREPVGVCALITPWNWPMNQIACKVAPALAAGCTMVLKPSENAPLSARLFAEILHEAGLPRGVFNLVNGDGPTVGEAMAAHGDVDLVSVTGSVRAGARVAHAAADTIKRVTQELGGKSANIILADADLETAVSGGVRSMMVNTGQSCNAPSRMLVPAAVYEEAVAIARETAEAIVPGDPALEATVMGPLSSDAQFDKVRSMIRAGVDEGARLVCGSPERAQGFDRGYFVSPAVFADVDNDMTIAREEIFGPVLCLIPYNDEQEGIRIANDTPYGLSGYVWSDDIEHARQVARKIRAGMIHINGAPPDNAAPFGGYKQSGNGREWGVFGLEEFLETKAILGGTGD